MTRKPRPTQADVARLAGVSTATVSYVVSGRSSRNQPASEGTRERVLKAMEELNYRPQWAARALVRQRSGMLTILTYAPLNPWAEELLTQIQAEAAEVGLETVILRYTDADHVLRQVKLIRGGLADGVVVLGWEDLGEEDQAALSELRVPVLAIANDGPADVSLLRQRERDAIEALMGHLQRNGVKRVTYIAEGIHTWKRVVRRTNWVMEAAQAHGLDPVVHRLSGPHPSSAEVSEALGSTMPGDAMLCGSDRSAVKMLWGALEQGVAVPENLRIIGMGNIEEGEMAVPALTTLGVTDPDYRPAIRHLLNRIEDPSLPPQHLDVAWELILRKSG